MKREDVGGEKGMWEYVGTIPTKGIIDTITN